jgi:anthranilate phosphoribosyltransferase
MLIRVREETAEELAGFVAAVRETIQMPASAPAVRVDWPSYAGKRRHLPWFLLAALLVARNGFPVLMHGIARAGDGRIYTPDALARLGLPVCASLAEAGEEIRKGGFAYVPLEAFAPQVARIIGLRALLGLRSPANSVARMLNPLGAPVQLIGIFHPNYRDIHQHAATKLGQPHMAVLRGEGGEAERNPDVPCLVQSACDGEERSEEWPAMFGGGRHLKDTALEIERLAAVWRGDAVDEYGEAAVVGTAAIALKALGVATTIPDAERAARRLWDERPKAVLKAA